MEMLNSPLSSPGQCLAMRVPAVCLASLLCLCAASASHGGAWPREDGTVFASLGTEFFAGEGFAPSVYLEYGLTPRLTIGADAWLSGDRAEGAGFAFARLPLSDPGGSSQVAAGLGFGVLLDDAGPAPAVRATLHWGRGLESGWLALDAELVARPGHDGRAAKLDATWGRRLAREWSAILLFTAGADGDGETYGSVTPSITWQASDRTTLRLGLTRRLSAPETGLAAQLWLTF